jgi:hypothetical protein
MGTARNSESLPGTARSRDILPLADGVLLAKMRRATINLLTANSFNLLSIFASDPATNRGGAGMKMVLTFSCELASIARRR